MQGDKQELLPISLDPKAYRFFPKRQEQKSAFEKKGSRFYFYGQIQHDQYQLRKIKQFHQYVHKKEKTYNKEFYDNDHIILQLLSANKYKPKDTLKAMKEHFEFKTLYVPSLSFQKVEQIIKSGFYYVCGRDLHFRPILVYKIKMVDKKNFQPYFDASVIIQEQIIKKMFLPGQVQSWNIIYDFQSMPIGELPVSTMKSILQKISLNYGGKLHKFWALNAPSGVSTVWKIISTFLDDVTVQKINISKTNSDKSIFQIAHPSQIEMKYGGTQPNRTSFDPMVIPKGVFNQKRLLSNEQYENLLKSGKLVRNVIDPIFTSNKE